MDPPIRPFRGGDASRIEALTLAAIRETGLAAYSRQQVEAWAARYSVERLHTSVARGDTILVAVDAADTPLAYMVLEAGGHVDMLYCHPDHAGRGLARQLLVEAEAAARAAGIAGLFTEASELARPVFERAGFRLVQRRDFAIPHAGGQVAIHNYAMEKRLA